MNFQVLMVIYVFFGKTLCSKFLYEISDEDYYKLPELFVLEHYEKCLSQRDTVYCVGTFELQAPQPSHVYDTLKKLTQHTIVNFNHTRLYRGSCLGSCRAAREMPCKICIHIYGATKMVEMLRKLNREAENRKWLHIETKKPKLARTYISPDISIGKCPINETMPLEKSFENCIDRDISKEYGLRAHLSHFDYCKNRYDKRKFDSIDRMFLLYISGVIFLNFIGTAYDISRKDRSKENTLMMAFSLRQNWRKLTNKVGTAGENFLCFHGMRAILTVLVHIAHAIMASVIGFLPNPRYVELMGDRPEFVLFFNGTLVIQTFIVMTSFLRTLKTFGEAERTKLGYKAVAEATIERYVRIAPAFITAVGLSATLIPHLGDGPLWKKHVEGEAELCRSTFWRQLFLLQNFYPPSCHPQAWYLSVDFQVYLITTIITVYLVRRKDEIPKVLSGLLATSLALLFTIVYFLELKPALQIMNPENLLSSFKFEKSFHLLYQSLWGNLPSAIIGIISACSYMKMKSNMYDLKKNKRFVLAFKFAMPVLLTYAIMGIWLLFTMTSPFTVSLYATIDKPVFAIIIGVFILGCIFKIEDIYRNVIEWQGWIVLSRLSLSALLMHVIVNRVLVANRLYPLNASIANVLVDGFGVSVITFMFSLPLCLMIEYPFIQLYKVTRSQNKNSIVAIGNSKTKDN